MTNCALLHSSSKLDEVQNLSKDESLVNCLEVANSISPNSLLFKRCHDMILILRKDKVQLQIDVSLGVISQEMVQKINNFYKFLELFSLELNSQKDTLSSIDHGLKSFVKANSVDTINFNEALSIFVWYWRRKSRQYSIRRDTRGTLRNGLSAIKKQKKSAVTYLIIWWNIFHRRLLH